MVGGRGSRSFGGPRGWLVSPNTMRPSNAFRKGAIVFGSCSLPLHTLVCYKSFVCATAPVAESCASAPRAAALDATARMRWASTLL